MFELAPPPAYDITALEKVAQHMEQKYTVRCVRRI